MRIRHLEKAPIKEAVFDIKVILDENFDTSVFELAEEKVKHEFPIKETRRNLEVTFELNPDKAVPPKTKESAPGVLFRNSGRTEILQFRGDGFTFNKLPPYTSYEELIARIKKYWELYKGIAKPNFVSRIALRYINGIPLGRENIQLEDFINVGPLLPPNLPQDVSAFSSRMTLEDYTNKVAAHIGIRLSVEDNLILYLDIDAFRRGTFEAEDNAIFESFETLRNFKNLIFFSFLTEKTIKEFE